ncbi:type II toxin-antitoxin system RelE/ParE family toxin [Desulfosarcina sp. OttesenSCG-928-G10]|nr:type II toxin-antitoxin system RelE/ParE family toxin [Desulfosarcina sp. OttesenSCG-928-G10]MDL2322214.1 type II toxin-antitoxin system RelE/ParE family toxin [Desulfosarcina sp. OttesenSCG-928-B08]
MNGEMPWKVMFTRHAKADMLGIFSFIAHKSGRGVAETILKKFIRARDSLRELPDRGRIPPELMRVNVLAYREILVTPYRIIYQVNRASHEVQIHVIADGRRNFTELLRERLLTSFR